MQGAVPSGYWLGGLRGGLAADVLCYGGTGWEHRLGRVIAHLLPCLVSLPPLLSILCCTPCVSSISTVFYTSGSLALFLAAELFHLCT